MRFAVSVKSTPVPVEGVVYVEAESAEAARYIVEGRVENDDDEFEDVEWEPAQIGRISVLGAVKVLPLPPRPR